MTKMQITKSCVLCCICLLSGCAHVEPWERDLLAKPEMAFDANPLRDAIRAQVHDSKEAASGSITAAGAGCGCN